MKEDIIYDQAKRLVEPLPESLNRMYEWMFFDVQWAFRLLVRIYIPIAHFRLFSEGRRVERLPPKTEAIPSTSIFF